MSRTWPPAGPSGSRRSAATGLLRDESKRAAPRERLAADRGDNAIVAENQRLHEELSRLRALLREHGIDPDAGTARTA